ncbi:MAG: 4'-phosphopantetheinyl transferase superfamily protein [Erysipelotrichales bacterium]|nr:4'-phosphopantetheinyl transferase superfamily protein [Erysipelotrichales bacterium]
MIGIDLVDITRMRMDEPFVNRVLTEEERELLEELFSDKRRKEFLAGRFAAKEAIYKATQDIHYLHYSILADDTGRPYVKDHPEIEISISHDGNMAIAAVMIQNLE